MSKKYILIALSILFLSALFVYASAYDSLDENTKKSVRDYISFDEKLKTCTPATLNVTDGYLKIHGLNNGICHYEYKTNITLTLSDSETNEKVSFSNGECRFPMPAAKQYATNRIKLTKAMYQMDNVKLSASEMKSMIAEQFNIVKQYCK